MAPAPLGALSAGMAGRAGRWQRGAGRGLPCIGVSLMTPPVDDCIIRLSEAQGPCAAPRASTAIGPHLRGMAETMLAVSAASRSGGDMRLP